MQAVILAGGLATRMYPRTLDVPKSLLTVAGRPFVAWQLEKLAECGFSDAVLCLGHLGQTVVDFVGDGSSFGPRVRYSFDGPRLLGTAGALRAALPLLEPVCLVTYGDSYLPFDYAAPLVDLSKHPEAAATMSVFENAGRWDSSNVAIDGQRVVRYAKDTNDPAVRHIDYGAFAVRRDVVAGIPPDTRWDLAAVFSELAEQGRLRAYTAAERFYEIGSEQGLRDLESRLQAP
jgi:NDP-sugar pyrophosphorylase family protein